MSNCQNNPKLVLLTKLKIIKSYLTRKKQIRNNVNIQNKILIAVYI